jgi:hypothetical protein
VLLLAVEESQHAEQLGSVLGVEGMPEHHFAGPDAIGDRHDPPSWLGAPTGLPAIRPPPIWSLRRVLLVAG